MMQRAEPGDGGTLAARMLATALAIVLAFTGQALAWGAEGDLLALDDATTLAEVSTWADQIRPQRRDTARWHYVSIPVHPPAGTPEAYDVARDCPTGDCVVAAIDRFAAVLRDSTNCPSERRS